MPLGRRGFTLVEILLVVVIISIMTGAVVVSFNGRRESRAMEFAAADLAAAMEFAAGEARSRQIPYRIAFDQPKAQYWLEERPIDSEVFVGSAGMGALKRSVVGMRLSMVLSGENSPASLPEFVEFNPDGSGFVGVIELRSDGASGKIQLEVMPHTGQIRTRFVQ